MRVFPVIRRRSCREFFFWRTAIFLCQCEYSCVNHRYELWLMRPACLGQQRQRTTVRKLSLQLAQGLSVRGPGGALGHCILGPVTSPHFLQEISSCLNRQEVRSLQVGVFAECLKFHYVLCVMIAAGTVYFVTPLDQGLDPINICP